MSLNTISQDHQIDLKLANNYFIEGDFEKAIMYFEKLENNKERSNKKQHPRENLNLLGDFENVYEH